MQTLLIRILNISFTLILVKPSASRIFSGCKRGAGSTTRAAL